MTGPPCCNALGDPEVMCDVMIAHLRANYGRHVGDPAWTQACGTDAPASPASGCDVIVAAT